MCNYIPVNCFPTAPSLSNTLGLVSPTPDVGFVPDVAFVPGAGAEAMLNAVSWDNGNREFEDIELKLLTTDNSLAFECLTVICVGNRALIRVHSQCCLRYAAESYSDR